MKANKVVSIARVLAYSSLWGDVQKYQYAGNRPSPSATKCSLSSKAPNVFQKCPCSSVNRAEMR
jgi:hypothetical protein